MDHVYIAIFSHRELGGTLDLAMALPELPFPLDELDWQEFGEVQKCVGLSPVDTMKVMKLVLGTDPPEVPLHHFGGTLLFILDLHTH